MNDDFLTVALHLVKSRMTVHWFPTGKVKPRWRLEQSIKEKCNNNYVKRLLIRFVAIWKCQAIFLLIRALTIVSIAISYIVMSFIARNIKLSYSLKN